VPVEHQTVQSAQILTGQPQFVQAGQILTVAQIQFVLTDQNQIEFVQADQNQIEFVLSAQILPADQLQSVQASQMLTAGQIQFVQAVQIQ
jgi:hypothetical protein